MTAPTRYGRTRVSTIYKTINDLRHAIRSEGTPEIQEIWDRLEPWIHIIFERKPHMEDDSENMHGGLIVPMMILALIVALLGAFLAWCVW